MIDMNILRSYGKPAATIVTVIQSLGFCASLIARAEEHNPVIAPGDYQWCRLSELNPDKGFTPVQVPLVTSSNVCSNGQGACFNTYTGQVARYANTYSDAYEPGELTLVYSDTRGLWCSASNVGCQPPEDFQDLEVLCDTPRAVHTWKSFDNETALPYFATHATNIHFPYSHLCTVSIETSEGFQDVMGASWSGEIPETKPEKPMPDKYCPVVLTYSDGGLSVDAFESFFSLQAPRTYMIAESRETARTISPECTSGDLPWTEARSKLVPPTPANASDVATAYPQEQITFCQAFTAGAGKKLAGVEFPEIRYSFGLGDRQKTLTGGCKLIDHELNSLVNQTVAALSRIRAINELLCQW